MKRTPVETLQKICRLMAEASPEQLTTIKYVSSTEIYLKRHDLKVTTKSKRNSLTIEVIGELQANSNKLEVWCIYRNICFGRINYRFTIRNTEMTIIIPSIFGVQRELRETIKNFEGIILLKTTS